MVALRRVRLFAGMLAVAWLSGLALGQASESNASAAEGITALPKCAVECLIAAIPRSTCEVTNQACLCTNWQLREDVERCGLASCSLQQALFARNVTATICREPIRDRAGQYNDISTTLGIISGVVVSIRLGYKLFITHESLAADDWLVLVALLVGIPGSVMNVHGMTANGLGKDVWTLRVDTLIAFARTFYFMQILYFAQVPMLKLTLLAFYLRIFPAVPIRRLLWITIVFNTLYGVAFVITAIFQCTPIDFYWHQWSGEHDGHCVNINALAWAHAAISIALDFWMLAIPLSQLRHLNLHWKKKVGVALMFGVGTFVTVVSIMRLQSLVHFATSTNPTWDQWDVANWSTVEINVGIICASMPAMRVVLVRLFPRLLGSSSRSRAGAYPGGSNINMSGSRLAPGLVSKNGKKGGGGDGSPGEGQKGGVLVSRSYSVRYDRFTDESQLVRMNELDADSAKAKSQESFLNV